jgi:SPP1 family predicted phage head-tail adaptor
MDAGALDRRIQFRRARMVDDGFTTAEQWEDLGGTIWAKKMDVSDGERWRAQSVAANITARFTVRYSTLTAAITAKDRLVCEDRDYDISGVKEIGRRQWLEITASARADQ